MGIKKILGITLATIGVAGTIAGTVLLPVGCLKEYKSEIKANDCSGMVQKVYFGSGISNYRDIRIKIIGPNIDDETNNFVSETNKEWKELNSEFRKNVKYSDFVKKAKNALDDPNIIINDMGGASLESIWSINNLKEYCKSIISANSTMIAVLLPVFAVIMILGIVLVVLGKNKKTKVAE